jgi:hypothetical protein
VAFAFGLSFGAPVLSREIFGARIVPRSRLPNDRTIVKDSSRA